MFDTLRLFCSMFLRVSLHYIFFVVFSFSILAVRSAPTIVPLARQFAPRVPRPPRLPQPIVRSRHAPQARTRRLGMLRAPIALRALPCRLVAPRRVLRVRRGRIKAARANFRARRVRKASIRARLGRRSALIGPYFLFAVEPAVR